ncbi:MFS transporter [Aestuariibius sp. 2305UL40-4]|uniref:MFS transporter n=1 Tax=Aestuariibius violaceus TaxID=3234132 RepID=UPI00345EC663
MSTSLSFRTRHDPSFCSEAARPWILIAAILASALGFIDGSIVSIALPAMREDLGATLAQATWISNGYMLPLSALILVGGAAGDRFGLVRVFGIGIIVFVAASIICALAPTPEVLIAGRALKGIGAALVVPGSLALIARAYPKAERGRAIGFWAASSALTTALGPILGGALLSFGGEAAWRLIFAINLPFGLFVLWILRAKVGQDRPLTDDGLDWIGAALISLSLGLGAWALTLLIAGDDASLSPALLGTGAALALILFLAQEARARHPMMPLHLFADTRFSAANLATFCLYFALGAILFYQPMTVIAGWGYSELAASAAFAPLSVFIGFLSGWVGGLADRVGPGKLVATGSALVAISFAGHAITAPLEAFWTLTVPLNCLMGFGMALVVGPLSTAVMASATDETTGAASGINNAISRMAGLIAVAAMGSVAAGVYAGPASFGAEADLPGHSEATNAAFAAIAWITAALSGIAAIVAWLGIAGRSEDDGSDAGQTEDVI